jgi:ribosome-binding ATPase
VAARGVLDCPAMQTGIIGLAQSGKTSLFRILTRAHLDAKAAHAAVHVGMAAVPDDRLDKLAALFKPRKVTHTQVEYMDLGALVQDRARDAAYLVALREADALAHVVRGFENPAAPHPAGSVNPRRDIENVEVELLLHDLEQVSRRLERLEKDLKKKPDPRLEHERALLVRCRAELEAERPLRGLALHAADEKLVSGFNFLSGKPMLIVLNLGDDEAPDIARAAEKHNLADYAARPGTAIVAVCGRIEAELAELDDAAAAELLTAYGLAKPGRERVLRATYELLGLISFFTVSETECRAWPAPRGTTAAKAAGIIHTDLERGFIRAEVVRWDELLEGGWAGARERGKVRLEGKEYVVRDGEIVHIRHSG